MSEAKKGFSMWSLMVIMTLLAVWMAVPRQGPKGRDYQAVLFFTSHQIAGWILISSLIWAGSGKRTPVLIFLATLLCVVWLPILCVIVTEPFSKDYVVRDTLAKVGLLHAYETFYIYVSRSFGYGLTG